MADQQEVVGFIGLGAMGTGMATNLLKYLQQQNETLHLYNRTPEKAKELVAAGAKLHGSYADLVKTCSIIFTMLSDDKAVEAVVEQIVAATAAAEGPGGPPLILVDCSTILPSTTAAMMDKAATVGIQYLTQPVFGRPPAAAAAQLIILLAGATAAKERVKPFSQSMGRAVINVGEKPPAANVMKLSGNFMLVGAVEIMAESFTLATRNGVDPDMWLALVQQMFPNPLFLGYGQRMVAGDTSSAAGFPVTLGMKDVGHMCRLAEESGVPLDVGKIVMERLRDTAESGQGDIDWGAGVIAALKKKVADFDEKQPGATE